MWWEERWSRVSLTYTVRFMACKYSIAIGSYTHDMDGGIWRSIQFLPNCFTSCTFHGSARDAYKRDDTDLPYIHPCNHPKLVSGHSCSLLCMQKGLPESLTLHNCLSMKKCFVEIKFVLVSCTFIHFFLWEFRFSNSPDSVSGHELGCMWPPFQRTKLHKLIKKKSQVQNFLKFLFISY